MNRPDDPDGRGPHLRLLGPIELGGVARSPTPQQLAMIAYLACVGPADRLRLVDAIWDGRPVSSGRVANLLAEVRAVLGPGHVVRSDDGRYALVGVVADLDRLEVLLASGPPGPDPVALQQAVDAVAGPVLSAPAGRAWRWLDRHPEVLARAEVAVDLATRRLVAGLIDRGELDRAVAICERGLARSPLDPELTRLLERLHRRQGRPSVATRLVVRWQRGMVEAAG